MLAYLFTDDSLLIHSSELLMISKEKHINSLRLCEELTRCWTRKRFE